VFQTEDFYDRYPGSFIDGAHITFADIAIEALHEIPTVYQQAPAAGYNWANHMQSALDVQSHPVVPSQYAVQDAMPPDHRAAKRRRTTNDSMYSHSTLSAEAHRSPPSDSSNGNINGNGNFQPQVQHKAMPQSCEQFAVQNHGQFQYQTLSQSALSPTYMLTPIAQDMALQNGHNDVPYSGHATSGQTVGAISASPDSAQEVDGDPFLSLLEQLAYNDGSGAGPTELDFFLNGQMEP